MTADDRSLLQTLVGGDRRSIGQSNAAVSAALADPACADELLSGLMQASDPVVRMRCADALEKFSRHRPEFIQRRRATLLQLLLAPQPKEVRWHLLQMSSRVAWPELERPVVMSAVRAGLQDGSRIVKVEALQALHDLGRQGEPFLAAAAMALDDAHRAPEPSVRARAARLRALR